MAAWFDRIAIYGPSPPPPKKKELKPENPLEELDELVPGSQGTASKAKPAVKPLRVVSSADCWLPGYEYLMAYYLHPRETPRCKYSNTVFRPLALHENGGTAPRPKITPTPPNQLWGGPSPIAQGAVPENFGRKKRQSGSFRGKQIQGWPGPATDPEEKQPRSKRVPLRRAKPSKVTPDEESAAANLPSPLPCQSSEGQSRRRSSSNNGIEAWDRAELESSRTSQRTPDRFSLKSVVAPPPPNGKLSLGTKKEDSRAFRYVRKLYNDAHRENFALKKIAEQEEEVYGEAMGGKKKGKRRLPGWLSGKKETLCNDGSHFFWVCQY